MNADELYEKMKSALYFFGLTFHQKELMTVKFGPGEIRFIYDGATVTYQVED